MNVIKIDMNKIRKMIDEYILNNGLSISVNEKLYIEYPIILMNEQTLYQIKKENALFLLNNYKNSFKMLFGCHIAIADWLPFGEVELK